MCALIYNPDIIRKQDPLKQGLKLFRSEHSSVCRKYSKARSTKTRIETEDTRGESNKCKTFESKIH